MSKTTRLIACIAALCGLLAVGLFISAVWAARDLTIAERLSLTGTILAGIAFVVGMGTVA